MSLTGLRNRQLLLKFLKLAGISGTIFIVSLVVVLTIIALIFQDRIKGALLESLNRNLQTEVSVEKIRLDLIRRFPLASVTFSGIKVNEAGNHQPIETLLEAQRIYLKFSIWRLVFGNYTISEVEISKASLNLRIFEDGSQNFRVWKIEPEDTTASNFAFDLKRVLLNEVRFVYNDKPGKHLIDLNIGRTTMSGNFRNESYYLSARGMLYANLLTIDSTVIAKERSIEIDMVLSVIENREFVFEKGNLKINENAFGVKGTFVNLEEGMFFDTQISGRQLSLGQLMADLPELVQPYISGYRARGSLEFEAGIKGPLTKTQKPDISATFRVSGAELLHRESGLNLNKLQFEGKFDNGQAQSLLTSTLSFRNFYTTINNGVLRGNFSMFNFSKPRLEFKLFADADAKDLVRLFRIDTISHAQGRINMDLDFTGGMSEKNRFTGQDFISARASGTFSYNNLSFSIKGNPLSFRQFNGSLLFSNNDLIVEKFSGHAGSSDFELKGVFRNVLPYLFLENEKIKVVANLYSNYLNFNELLKHSVSGSDTTYRLSFSERLGFNLETDVVHLAFRKFEATNVKGRATLQNKRFMAQDVIFRAMDGQVKANGYIDGTKNNYFDVGVIATVNGVDINKLFYQMGNFGQTSITDQHLFGKVTSDLKFTGRWTPTLEVDWKSIETTAKTRIDQGTIINFEPLTGLGRFLRIDDMSRVTFSTLENQIQIKDRKIIIPDMEIKSSAINLKLSGQHGFNNEIDYRVQVLLSEILSRKNRQNRNPQEQFGHIIDDGLGRTTLFLRISGTASEPVFRYDVQGVREKIRDDFRREGQNLRDAFRREFGGGSEPEAPASENIAPEPKPRIRNPLRRQRQQNNERFELEWDENNP